MLSKINARKQYAENVLINTDMFQYYDCVVSLQAMVRIWYIYSLENVSIVVIVETSCLELFPQSSDSPEEPVRVELTVTDGIRR